MPPEPTRLEHDLLGEKAIPADAYFGVQTARGLENFHISGVQLRLYPDLIKALAMVKWAAARANHECGQFDAAILRGIEGACREIIDGRLHDQFLLDVFQGGAGTSTNMNINEVVANRALELMGHQKGDYSYCDPHDHVNASQSTNDAYPTAIKLAVIFSLKDTLAAMAELRSQLQAREKDFGQTPLQWTLYGSVNGWYVDSGDYPRVAELLLEAGAIAPPITRDTTGTEAVIAVVRRHSAGKRS